MGEKRLILQYC